MENDGLTIENVVGIIVGFIFLAILVALYVWLLIIVGKTATKRGENVTHWILLSFCFSPLLSLFALYLIGDKKQ